MALADNGSGLPSGDLVAIGDLHFPAFPRTFALADISAADVSAADPATAANITWDELIFLPGDTEITTCLVRLVSHELCHRQACGCRGSAIRLPPI